MNLYLNCDGSNIYTCAYCIQLIKKRLSFENPNSKTQNITLKCFVIGYKCKPGPSLRNVSLNGKKLCLYAVYHNLEDKRAPMIHFWSYFIFCILYFRFPKYNLFAIHFTNLN